jgi:hypothetical protein
MPKRKDGKLFCSGCFVQDVTDFETGNNLSEKSFRLA